MKRILALVCIAALVPSTLFAVVPDPDLSITPPCIRLFPSGGLTLSGQVIGNNGLPLGNEEVRLVFAAACTALLECPAPGTTPTVIATIADGSGNFSFSPNAGGCCTAAISATIEADPGAVTLEVYGQAGTGGGIGSPDNTGNLEVSLADFVNFQAAFNSAGTCNDIDGSCNLNVSLADFVVFQSQFGPAGNCP